jgi:hypothetical protein
LLGEKLREPEFLSRVVDEFNARTQDAATTAIAERTVIDKKLAALEAKRQRILEAFFDGAINKAERDGRIAQVDADFSAFKKILIDTIPVIPDVRSETEIEQALEPFAEWEFLEREDKRALLAAICPEIQVERYVVKSLMINLLTEGSNEVRQNRAAGASLRGRCARIPAIRPKTARHGGQGRLRRAAESRRRR